MKVIDPVCKMSIEDKDAVARSEHKGKNYYYCSLPCKDDFDRYLASFRGEGGEVSVYFEPARDMVHL